MEILLGIRIFEVNEKVENCAVFWTGLQDSCQKLLPVSRDLEGDD